MVRRWIPRLVFVGVLAAQLFFLVRAPHDPHKHFAWRPFNESDEWRAEVVRVTVAGARVPVEEPWAGYTWSELVQVRGLAVPRPWKHAASGARSVRVFLGEALDWVAAHTPNDRETLYYEARFEWKHNRRGPFSATLRSRERDVR
jgi:hypothetical protein